MNKKRLTKLIVLCAALAVYGVVRSPENLAAGPTDAIASCLVEAYIDAIGCINDLPWYATMLCNLRFNSDVILCLPKSIARI